MYIAKFIFKEPTTHPPLPPTEKIPPCAAGILVTLNICCKTQNKLTKMSKPCAII